MEHREIVKGERGSGGGVEVTSVSDEVTPTSSLAPVFSLSTKGDSSLKDLFFT